MLNLKKIVNEQVPDCKVIIPTSTVRSDDGKAGLTVSQLINHLQFFMPGFTSPYRFDRTKDGGGILVYIREDIPSKLLNISYIA